MNRFIRSRKLKSALGLLWVAVLLYAFLHPSVPGNYQMSAFQPHHAHASEMEREIGPHQSDGGIHKMERRAKLPLLVFAMLFALAKLIVLIPSPSANTAKFDYLIRRIRLLLPLKFTSTFVDVRAGLVRLP